MTDSQPDLLSVTLRLQVSETAPPSDALPQWWGRAVHALLLRSVRLADPALADSLHHIPGAGEDADAETANPQGLRPFSASTLVGYSYSRGLQAGRDYAVRMTSCTPALSAILAAAAQPGGALSVGQTVDLDGHNFTIQPPLDADWRPPRSRTSAPDLEGDSGGLPVHHPQSGWSGAEGYQALAARYLAPGVSAPRRVSLQFASPVSFRSGGRDMPLPLPELVFGSLLERWNAFAPIVFPAEARRYAAECLAISRFELSSRAAPGKRGSYRHGAVGQVTYSTTSYDRYWMAVLNTLASFALYSGVGAAISQGLGQARLLKDQR